MSDRYLALDVKFARVNADTDGDNTVITGVTGKRIRVVAYLLTVSAAGTVTVKDDATVPNVLAEFTVAANAVLPFAGSVVAPAFETAAGEGLVINTQVGQDVNGHLAYHLV